MSVPRSYRWPRRFSAAVISATMIVAACGGDDGGQASGDTSPPADVTTTVPTTTAGEVPLQTPPQPAADYTAYRELTTACSAEQPPPREELQFDAPDDLGIDPTSAPIATIVTSCGDIVVELDPAAAPATVNSFAFLAEADYFDGTVSHRIVPGFVIQAGDPTATGLGGPGYVIPDELPEEGFLYERGLLAMANAGPNTTGSQFFIVQGDAALPPQFSVFGRVIEGMDVVDTIVSLPLGIGPTGEQSAPLEAMYIEDVIIER